MPGGQLRGRQRPVLAALQTEPMRNRSEQTGPRWLTTEATVHIIPSLPYITASKSPPQGCHDRKPWPNKEEKAGNPRSWRRSPCFPETPPQVMNIPPLWTTVNRDWSPVGSALLWAHPPSHPCFIKLWGLPSPPRHNILEFQFCV